jgi:hypothetical protein
LGSCKKEVETGFFKKKEEASSSSYQGCDSRWLLQNLVN